MSRVQASDVSVDRDETGGMAKFDWTCPHCGEVNPEFIFSSNFTEVTGDFEMDCECGWCGEAVTVECVDAGPLF